MRIVITGTADPKIAKLALGMAGFTDAYQKEDKEACEQAARTAEMYGVKMKTVRFPEAPEDSVKISGKERSAAEKEQHDRLTAMDHDKLVVLCEQYVWERDVAMSQLKDLGIGFAENVWGEENG